MYRAAKAIIKYQDSLFLQLRDNNNSIPYPNLWAFFGGRLLKDEDPIEGLLREIKEELSYPITNYKHFHEWYNQETKTQIIYFLINLREKIDFNEIKEGQLGKWYLIKDLNTISLAPDIKAIKFKL